MFNVQKLEKLHKPLTVLLLLSTITMGYFLYEEYQRNNKQEEVIKKLIIYIEQDIKSIKGDVDNVEHYIRDLEYRIDYIEGYLNY